jgi:WD40-like Beta Propeller Repeat
VAVRAPTRATMHAPALAPAHSSALAQASALALGSALALALATMLALGGPFAQALPARGHVFAFSFESEGEPRELALDEATGQLYVVDRGAERVQIFEADASGHYKASGEFKVRSPGAIAVDNSSNSADPSRGFVYVVGAEEKHASSDEEDYIYEYDPALGEVVHKYKEISEAKLKGSEPESEELEDISGLAVDAHGTLWVYFEEEGIIYGLSKEPAQNNAGAILAWEPSLTREPEIESHFECDARGAFAVASGEVGEPEAFYAGYERESASEECPGEQEEAPDAAVIAKLAGSGAVLQRELLSQSTSGVALAGEGPANVYLDGGEAIAAFTPEGKLIERFGGASETDPEGRLQGASSIAIAGEGEGAEPPVAGQVLVAEPAQNRVLVFVPEKEPKPPSVDAISAQNLSPTQTELKAQIDPGGAQTEYVFQYGSSECTSNSSACSELPAGQIPWGFGDQGVSVALEGLAPASTYYYRVVAKNADGGAEAVPQPNTFTTLPSPNGLPDGRAWELVSPAEKHSATLGLDSPSRGGLIEASTNGEAISWLSGGPLAGEAPGNRSFEFTQLLSRRTSEGWSTESLETPHGEGRGLYAPSPAEYHLFSPDLSESIVQPSEPFGSREEPPLSPEATEKTIYVRSSSGQFTPLVSGSNDSAHNPFGGKLEFLDATSDLQHVVFESQVGLDASTPTAAGLYEWDSESRTPQLVSILPGGGPAPDEGQRIPSLGAGEALNYRGALSSDGSHVIWSTTNEKALEEDLYLRDSARGETIKLNAAQGQEATEAGSGGQSLPEPPEGEQIVHFQAATPDGSRIFFTDTARLAEESSEQPTGESSPADLYEYEITSAPNQALRGRLRDLSADPVSASADVLGLIPGIGDDGADVYFVANGALSSEATPGDCTHEVEGEAPPQASCNLYLSHEGQLRFIARLSQQDAADWAAGSRPRAWSSEPLLSTLSASVSPDGRFLAFSSQNSLTGYDNRDAESAQNDEELYLYDADTDRLSCASCNPNEQGGAFKAPRGAFDPEPSAEGQGLLADRSELWRDRWLGASLPSPPFNFAGTQPTTLYSPRYLTDNGRLFFDSSDDLLPQAESDTTYVYEYEPGGVGSCSYSSGCIGLISSPQASGEATFLDASENGDDVFFATSAELVPADIDQAYDVYDAHVCSEASPCLPSKTTSTQQCGSEEACRGAFSAPAQPPISPGTIAPQPQSPAPHQTPSPAKGPAKPKAPTRAQRLAKALSECRHEHRHSRSRRLACERKARKAYGRKAKAKRKSKKRGSKGSARSGGR